MNSTRDISRGLASLVVLATATVAATGCTGNLPSGRASASPPAEVAATGCLREDGGCLGVLRPGTYQSQSFTTFGDPSPGQLTYTVRDGSWANALDHSPAYWFQPAEEYAAGTGDDFLPGVYVWSDVAAAAQEFPGCPELPDPTVPTDAAGLLAWVSALPGLRATAAPTIPVGEMSIEGLDIVVDPENAPSCSWGTFVPLIAARPEAPDAYMWGVGGSERLQLYPVDLGEEHTAAIIIDSPASEFDSILPAAQELIASFEFFAPCTSEQSRGEIASCLGAMARRINERTNDE